MGRKVSAFQPRIFSDIDPAADLWPFVDVSEVAALQDSVTSLNDIKKAMATGIGPRQEYITATQMTARTTNGADPGSVETSSNKVMLKTLDFDTTTQEFAQIDWAPPKSWNLGTIKLTFFWSHPATSVNFGVTWGADAVAIATNTALDVAFGTEQKVTSTGGVTDRLYVSAATAAITVAGSPAFGNLVLIRIHRDPADAGDNLAVDARLQGVLIEYTTAADTDA